VVPTKVADVEGISEYRLPNGLRVLLFPDPSKPTITVNITYLVGSRHENYGETGMAHLLEHLLFKGTPKHPNIDQEFNKRGVRFNGTTWLDRTNYYELFQASDDNLAWAIELEADRMVNSNIAKTDLDSEMTVVRNEYESGENSPFGVMLKRIQSIAYDWHSYGRSTIGNKSDIENVRIENLQAFYRMYYQPDNAVLLAWNDTLNRYAVPRALPDELLADWNFYLAYNLFRMGGILQGIAKRVETGTASSAQARQAGAGARPLAEMGWALAQQA